MSDPNTQLSSPAIREGIVPDQELSGLALITSAGIGEILDFMDNHPGNAGLLSRNILRIVDVALQAQEVGETKAEILDSIRQGSDRPMTT